MGVEHLPTRAQIAQPGFAARGSRKPVLGAAAVAQRQGLAAVALSGQRRAFGFAEDTLSLAPDQPAQNRNADVTQKVRGIDEVIATVDIAVVIGDQHVPTLLAKNAQRVLGAHQRPESLIDDLHDHLAHVLPDPLVEDAAEKPAPFFGRDGACGDASCGGRVALDQGQKLQGPRAQ